MILIHTFVGTEFTGKNVWPNMEYSSDAIASSSEGAYINFWMSIPEPLCYNIHACFRIHKLELQRGDVPKIRLLEAAFRLLAFSYARDTVWTGAALSFENDSIDLVPF